MIFGCGDRYLFLCVVIVVVPRSVVCGIVCAHVGSPVLGVVLGIAHLRSSDQCVAVAVARVAGVVLVLLCSVCCSCVLLLCRRGVL